jgi:hypothetical protein
MPARNVDRAADNQPAAGAQFKHPATAATAAAATGMRDIIGPATTSATAAGLQPVSPRAVRRPTGSRILAAGATRAAEPAAAAAVFLIGRCAQAAPRPFAIGRINRGSAASSVTTRPDAANAREAAIGR